MDDERYCALKLMFVFVSTVLYFTVMPLVGAWAWNALAPFFARAGVHWPVVHYKEMWLMLFLAWLLFK